MTEQRFTHVIDPALISYRAKRYQSALPRPFLRWAGSKRSLAPQIIGHLPETFNTYWEPFLGGGTMFFLLQPRHAILADTASELIETYRAVREHPIEILRLLDALDVSKETFDRIKRLTPGHPAEVAARFIYLNKTAWNGLYRVNSRGEYNVPYGRPKSQVVADSRNIWEAARALNEDSIDLQNQDFRESVAGVQPNDLVFLDPPYVTSHNNNGFVDYNKTLFSWQDQVDLAEIARELRSRGAKVIVTNAHHAAVADLYRGFTAHTMQRYSTLASDAAKRRPTTEYIFVS